MRRLLLIDDDCSAVDALESLLELDGFEVAKMYDAARALERLRLERFDAVVTDLEMPLVNGVAIVRAARAASPPIPALVVTAYAGSPAASSAADQGAYCVLAKPLEYDDLHAALRAALGVG